MLRDYGTLNYTCIFLINVSHSELQRVIHSGVSLGRFGFYQVSNCNVILEFVGHVMILTDVPTYFRKSISTGLLLTSE